MISQIINSLQKLLQTLADIKKEKTVERDNALRSLSTALNETYIYYSNYEKDGPNKEVEAQLARYWAAAAIPIRHFDRNLALACEHKSEYWVDPTSFDDAHISSLSIELGQMRDRYREILSDLRTQ